MEFGLQSLAILVETVQLCSQKLQSLYRSHALFVTGFLDTQGDLTSHNSCVQEIV